MKLAQKNINIATQLDIQLPNTPLLNISNRGPQMKGKNEQKN